MEKSKDNIKYMQNNKNTARGYNSYKMQLIGLKVNLP